jgi:hypothetical protein
MGLYWSWDKMQEEICYIPSKNKENSKTKFLLGVVVAQSGVVVAQSI